jgi:hypothetical protein
MGGAKLGGPHWVQGGFFARMRARGQVLAATEAELRARGLPIPKIPMSREKAFGIGLGCGLLIGLLIGLIFRQLT